MQNETPVDDQNLPRHPLEWWLAVLREHPRRQSSQQPAWESLSKRERLARIRAVRGKYKDVLSPSTVFNQNKQNEIDRE